MNIFDEVRAGLESQAEEKYQHFHKSLVPGDNAAVLGVRIPKLRERAKNIARSGDVVYSEYIGAVISAWKAGTVYQEELHICGMIIGYIKCSNQKRRMLLDDFIPMIDNWAVCDCSCSTYKFMRKDGGWYEYIMKYIRSSGEYEIRFAVVCMLDHFINDTYIDNVLKTLQNISHEAYYVKMAAAWALAECYIKYPEKTWAVLSGDKLDNDTHKKAIQKIRDSYRVGAEEKERLNALKRK